MKNSLVKIQQNSLSKNEKEEFGSLLRKIKDAINDRNLATSRLITYVSEVLRKKLWVDDYESENEFIKSILHMHYVSYSRFAKANRIYLYLRSVANNEEEKLVLSLMKESTYRELRRIATNGNKPIMIKGETEEQYRNRIYQEEQEDLKLIRDLWSKIYPHIRNAKIDNNKVLPTGGFYISENDILIASQILQKTLDALNKATNGADLSTISVGEIGGRDISLEDIVNMADEYSPEVIDAINRLGISEAITEKLKRQNQHIKDKLNKAYTFDRYSGVLFLKNGRLCIDTQIGVIDLAQEVGDLIDNKQHTVISIRRMKRDPKFKNAYLYE